MILPAERLGERARPCTLHRPISGFHESRERMGQRLSSRDYLGLLYPQFASNAHSLVSIYMNPLLISNKCNHSSDITMKTKPKL
jgi:hypothetical protein